MLLKRFGRNNTLHIPDKIVIGINPLVHSWMPKNFGDTQIVETVPPNLHR